MIGGVTYTYAILNLIVTGELFLITKSFWVLLAALVIHAIGYAGSIREPRFFDIWVTRVRTCPRTRNFSFWGGNSYAP
jgi:type IV secretion system protein VirB3